MLPMVGAGYVRLPGRARQPFRRPGTHGEGIAARRVRPELETLATPSATRYA